MSWIAVIVLPAGSFLVAALLLRVRRGGWTVLGATLLFGLAGYALQGSPDQPASPGQAQAADDVDGELLVEARRERQLLVEQLHLAAEALLRRGNLIGT